MSYSTSRRKILKKLSLASAAALTPGLISQSLGASLYSANPLGIALVGLGNYATRALAPAFAHTQNCKLTGIVTGTPEKAEQWKKDYEIPDKNIYNYDNFDQIADNPDIDIIYIVLPNFLHAPFTIRAAKAGKHVICEKPMALNAEECRQMIAACKTAGVKLSIGYRLHFEKHHQEMMRLGNEKTYGNIKFITGGLGFRVRDTSLWRLDKEKGGGGAIMDLGVYPLQASRYMTGMEPISVTAQGYNSEPEIFRGIYETIAWQLAFPNGTYANLHCSYGHYIDQIRAAAERGWYECKPSFNGTGTEGETSDGKMDFPHVVQQALQMDDFASCIKENRESRISGKEGLKDLIIIDAIKQAAKTGRRIELGGIKP